MPREIMTRGWAIKEIAKAFRELIGWESEKSQSDLFVGHGKRVHALEILSCIPRDTPPSVDEVPDKEWCWIAEKESLDAPVGFCQWTCEQGDIIRGRMSRVGRYVWLPLYGIPRPSGAIAVATQEVLDLGDEVGDA